MATLVVGRGGVGMAFGAVWFACRESGYLWRRRRLHWLGIGGSSLHTLRSGYVPCFLAPHLLPLLLWGGLGGRESFDYFHRLRLIPGKGHCSLWAAETKRLALPRANNSQDRPAPKNNSPAPPAHTHVSDNSDVDWRSGAVFSICAFSIRNGC